MKTEAEIKDMLNLIKTDEDFHIIVIKDLGITEIKTAKEVLEWVLK